MRTLCAIALMLAVTGCGCALDPGDSLESGKYFDGCWAAAERKNR